VCISYKRTDLRGAELNEANLEGTKLSLPDLYILKQQPPDTLLRAFKILREDWRAPYQKLSYKNKIGKWVEYNKYDTDERKLFGEGLDVATLEWCLKKKFAHPCYIIVEVEFYAKDIVAIPYATDGRFRVRRMRVLREVKEEVTIQKEGKIEK